jgi:hypothetical protein
MALTKVHANIIEGLEEHIERLIDYLPLKGGTITGDLNISTAIVDDWSNPNIYNNPEGMNKNSLVVKGGVTEKVYTWEWTPDGSHDPDNGYYSYERTHEIDPTKGSIQVNNWPIGYQPGLTLYTIDSDKWKNGQSVNLTINMETVLLEDRDVVWPDSLPHPHPNHCEINWINCPTSTEDMDPWTGDWTSRDTKIVPNSNAYNVLIVKLWKTNDTMYGQRVGGYGIPLREWPDGSTGTSHPEYFPLSTSLKGAKSNVSRW